MSVESLFQSALREWVQPSLKLAGFSKKGTTYRRMNDEVVHVVVAQKSRKSTADEIVFAVNLGVASRQLLQRAEVEPAALTVEGCHWRRRLSAAGTEEESWWTVHDERSAQQAAEEVARALESRGLPVLESLLTDASLRDLWLSGRSPGLTDVQRLLNLAVLTAKLGPVEEANGVIRALKQISESTPVPAVLEYLREVGAA